MRRRVPAGQLEMFRQRAKVRDAREADFRAQALAEQARELVAVKVDAAALAAVYARWLERQPPEHPWKSSR